MVVAKWHNEPWAASFQRWLIALLLAGMVVIPWGLIGGRPAFVTIWYAVLGLTLLAFSVGFAKQSMSSSGNTAGRWLAGAVLLSACKSDCWTFCGCERMQGWGMLHCCITRPWLSD